MFGRYEKPIIIVLTILSLAGIWYTDKAQATPPEGAVLVTEYYTVQNEVLWDIAAKFIDKNTYGTRDIREFISGIIELNYDRVFKDRPRGEVHLGDVLQINYWIKKGGELKSN
jgi:hypothetical protein